ncbi:MAG: DUF2079 domain-containing protein, partial [Planctomycetaceae bacterium]
ILCLVTGSMWLAVCLQALLGVRTWSATVISPASWQRIVESLNGEVLTQPDGGMTANIGFSTLFFLISGTSIVTWLLGAALCTRNNAESRRSGWRTALAHWGWNGWRWWWLAGAWEVLRIASYLIGWEGLGQLIVSTPQFFLAIAFAGWLTEFFTLLGFPREITMPNDSPALLPPGQSGRFAKLAAWFRSYPRGVWIAVALYVVVLTAMNWQLYFGLWIPHGDSAMYEEHLWNLLNGKGFRSYLDQGLFLGEHIQVIHLLLLPLYVLWPSHLLLELSQSAILALGALPVYAIARRHTGSSRAAACLAWAYLLYFPLQFLDIAIDLKTFRPNAFGVPILLATINQFELRRFRNVWIGVLLTLSAQEDFSIILACWGIWMIVFPRATASDAPSAIDSSRVRKHGIGLLLFNVVYLVLVLRVVIPWFRSGVEIHYSSYFSKFGNSIPEIASNILLHPMQTLGIVVNVNFFVYALALLVPLGFIPLRAWHRLLIAFPLFVTLCLNEVAANPRHHFHAPVIPFLFWGCAVGLGYYFRRVPSDDGVASPRRSLWIANWVWTSSLTTAMFFSLSPIGIAFWDPGSLWHWRHLYVPGPRAENFPAVLEKIPRDSRVASTDFIHPRFTHYERSYDYSHYKRRVSGYELTVPDDTEYIVIDTAHPYSEIKTPDQVREFREHPDRWELLPDDTDGYYIVLKRKVIPPTRL